jgi:competence ComEA-like helix-hairpin-helix protein
VLYRFDVTETLDIDGFLTRRWNARVVDLFRQEALMRIICRPIAVIAVCSAVALATASSAVATERVAERPQVRTPSALRTDPSSTHDSKDHPIRVRTAAPHASDTGRHETGKVNINSADVKELMTLTGVGRKVAERIVEYRDNHGPFKKADELRKVEGVGTGVWEKNRDRIVTK